MKKKLFSSHYFLTWTFVSMIILAAQCIATGATTFQDSAFTAGWIDTLITGTGGSASGATFISVADAAGFPSLSRKTTHNYPAGGDIFVAHEHSPSSYNPAGGAIVTLTYSYDAISYTPLNVAYSFLVKQGGTYYICTPEDYSGGAWASFGQPNLTAANFLDVTNRTSDKHPDFSCNGSPIVFGYLTRNHNPHSVSEQTISAIDNWKVTLNTSNCSTPTPTATATATATPTPIPGCAQVTGEVGCLPSGGYSYTFNVTNNSGNGISQILLTPVQGSTFTLTPELTNLASPLQNGQLTTVSTTIGNARPGDEVCLFVTLMSEKTQCCIVQVCSTLPQCREMTPTPPPPPTPRLRPGKKRP